ncbi:MAG: RNA 3'-terminal phosphate cyclase [Planctomycetes bacterium]|nr:RNA 3'-terminal phosphate cyclase [Planctomycetota bacterium]
MLAIDGRLGEGGGQILRSALALSAITGTPVRLEHIRAGRPKPGLQRQHLASVRAAARVCGAEITGDELGSRELTFIPHGLCPGEHHIDIGSAGSASLVLQTVIPPLLRAGAPSRVVVDGGTHNPLAPPFEFLRDTFCPVLARIGATVTVSLERHGFYPAGGGRLVAEIQPLVEPWPLELMERGRPTSRRAVATIAHLPAHVASREAQTLKHALKWSHRECDEVEIHACDGPGNIVTVTMAYQHITETVSAVGAMRVPAEEVALRAAKEAQRYLDSDVPVGEHLADQLLLPLAIARGGRFRTGAPSLHATTNAQVISAFLGERIAMSERADGDWLIEVMPNGGTEQTPTG